MKHRCRLSFGVPAESDASLESRIEKATSVDGEFIRHTSKPSTTSRPAAETWPDSYAIAFSLFSLFVANASIVVIWLIILSSYGQVRSTDDWVQTCLKALFYGVPLLTMTLNLVFAWLAKTRLNSQIISFAFGSTSLAWGGFLLLAISKSWIK